MRCCVATDVLPMVVADKAAVIENSFCGFLLTILSYVIIVFTMPFSLCLCLKVTDSGLHSDDAR